MEEKIKIKNSRIEAKKLSELNKQKIEPLKQKLLTDVIDNEYKIKTKVQNKLIK
jgi:hypothetical protein